MWFQTVGSWAGSDDPSHPLRADAVLTEHAPAAQVRGAKDLLPGQGLEGGLLHGSSLVGYTASACFQVRIHTNACVSPEGRAEGSGSLARPDCGVLTVVPSMSGTWEPGLLQTVSAPGD